MVQNWYRSTTLERFYSRKKRSLFGITFENSENTETRENQENGDLGKF